MNFVTKIVRLILVVLVYVPVALAENVVVSEVMPADTLISALQSGGHIIYMRHGITDHSQKDKNRQDFTNCDEQRNLSPEGIQQVSQIGAAMRFLNIPVSNVHSSPYCRCKDTAKLVFGEYNVESDLEFSISKNKKDSARLGNRLYQLMYSNNDLVGNVAFVGHSANLKDGLGVWPKPEGVIAIFKREEGRLIYRGLIEPSEWPPQNL